VSESFGECEFFLGASGNVFQNAIREQAAAEGITYITSSGDEGSATCDRYSGSIPDPATHGFAVNVSHPRRTASQWAELILQILVRIHSQCCYSVLELE